MVDHRHRFRVYKLLIILFIGLVANTLHGQSLFDIDITSPCPNQTVTLMLPSISGCTNARLVRTSLVVSPTPTSITDIVYTAGSPQGVIGVSITFSTYTGTLIEVHADYTCNGVTQTEEVYRSFSMKPPLSVSPTISGLTGNIYSGDNSTAVAGLSSPPSGTTYSWSLSVVSTIEGSINSAAIASPSSNSTQINWPSGFVGDVDITVTATSCGVSRTSSASRVNVKYTPYHSFGPGVLPAINCSGSVVTYTLVVHGGFTFFNAPLIHTSGGASPGSSTLNTSSVSWPVTWTSDGGVSVSYKAKDSDNRVWDVTTATVTFDVAEFNPGVIQVTQPSPNCGPLSITLTKSSDPGSDYVWQYCNTVDCGLTSLGWVNNTSSTSSTFNGVSVNTSFRIKLTETRCGTYASNVVSVIAKPTPSITIVDHVIFSGNSFDIPGSDVAGAQVSVTATPTGVTGASGFSVFQDGPGGIVRSQPLTTNGSVDGTVIYSIQVSKDQCFGEPKNVTVTVYKKPAITSNPKVVYRGNNATLSSSTGSYDTYHWQDQSGNSLATSATYTTGVAGLYKVIVTKNGIQGESSPYRLGLRLDGLNENYITTRVPLDAFKSVVGFEDQTELKIAETVQYIDGLGRPVQSVSTRMSPLGRDIVQPVVYDQFGREVRKYLPYVSPEDNGRLQSDAISIGQPQFYQSNSIGIASDTKPYAETVFESSPLNRVVEQGAPGAAWQPESNRTVRTEYLLNVSNEVILFTYDSQSGELSYDTDTFYEPSTLFRNRTIDEDDHNVFEYVDKQGRTLCKKVQVANGVYATTYYIYDQYGNLSVVLPPEAVERIVNEN